MLSEKFDLLLHLDDKEYQWYSLGWSNQFIRYLTGSWKNIKINNIITLTCSNANIIQCKVVSIEKSSSLHGLIRNSNYINLYPLSQNIKTTYYYIQNKLRRQSKSNIDDELKVGLFTIKII